MPSLFTVSLPSGWRLEIRRLCGPTVSQSSPLQGKSAAHTEPELRLGLAQTFLRTQNIYLAAASPPVLAPASAPARAERFTISDTHRKIVVQPPPSVRWSHGALTVSPPILSWYTALVRLPALKRVRQSLLLLLMVALSVVLVAAKTIACSYV